MSSYQKAILVLLLLFPLTLFIFFITNSHHHQHWHKRYLSRPLGLSLDAVAGRDCRSNDSCFKSRDVLENNPDYEDDEFKGKWELASENPGISAMHMLLFPNTNKAIMLDAVSLGPSNVRLPVGIYRLNPGAWNKYVDYRAHAVEYDTDSAAIRPLRILTDTWSSSGGLSANGTVVISGGWSDGGRTVRYLSGCYNACDWTEHRRELAAKRWFSTQQILPDGNFIVVGGRRTFSYEYILREANAYRTIYELPLLNETTDPSENNLYPFVFLSTDGNLFIFANDRSVLLDPSTNTVIHQFPILRGGSRNYPASATSALLPVKLHDPSPDAIRAEVLICGGAKPEAAKLAGKGEFMTALQDCGRIEITNYKSATWQREMMPSPRVMGDMLLLPTGDVLIVNGAKRGTAGWNFAAEPNMTPVLYEPDDPVNERFTELTPTRKPRMCHSTSAVLPDGKILVAGSNPNLRYNLTGGSKYPTELRVEKFYPPYFDESLASYRPSIASKFKGRTVKYGQSFVIQFRLEESEVSLEDLKVTMYAPPFTTHGVAMGQRLIELAGKELVDVGSGTFQVSVMAPPTAKIAPPGYYLNFVVYRKVPSPGTWVQIG